MICSPLPCPTCTPLPRPVTCHPVPAAHPQVYLLEAGGRYARFVPEAMTLVTQASPPRAWNVDPSALCPPLRASRPGPPPWWASLGRCEFMPGNVSDWYAPPPPWLPRATCETWLLAPDEREARHLSARRVAYGWPGDAGRRRGRKPGPSRDWVCWETGP